MKSSISFFGALPCKRAGIGGGVATSDSCGTFRSGGVFSISTSSAAHNCRAVRETNQNHSMHLKLGWQGAFPLKPARIFECFSVLDHTYQEHAEGVVLLCGFARMTKKGNILWTDVMTKEKKIPWNSSRL
jgi:hypothetical protein